MLSDTLASETGSEAARLHRQRANWSGTWSPATTPPSCSTHPAAPVLGRDAAPSVDAPLGRFSVPASSARTPPAPGRWDRRSRTLYCYLPMPFADKPQSTWPAAAPCPPSASATRSGTAVRWEFRRRRLPADRHRDHPTVLGQNPILDTVGAGTSSGHRLLRRGPAALLPRGRRSSTSTTQHPAFKAPARRTSSTALLIDHGPYTQPLSGNPAT